MANDQAWAIGAQIGQDIGNRRRERKEALQDEDRRNRVSELYDQGHKLSTNIAALRQAKQDVPPEMMKALVDTETGIKDIYNPIHNPGALQKDWGHLVGLITRKPPQIGLKQDQQRAARLTEATGLAERDVTAATGLSTEQQAKVNQDAAALTEQLEIDSRMKVFDRYRPDASKEDRDRYLTDLLGSVSGIKNPSTLGKFIPRVATLKNGQKLQVMYNEKDGRIANLNGTAISDELLNSLTLDPVKARNKVRGGLPLPVGNNKWAQIWVDPSDPGNKSLWAWTDSEPSKGLQTSQSETATTDPLTGMVTKGLRKTGPANLPVYDLTGIGKSTETEMVEGAPEEPDTQGTATPQAAPAPARSAAPPAAHPAHPTAAPSATPRQLRQQVPSQPVVTNPSAPVGTYDNPLPVDGHGEIPAGAKPAALNDQQWDVIRTQANRLLGGASTKDLGGNEKLNALAQSLAAKYGWSPQGLFTPKDKLLIRVAGSYLKKMRDKTDFGVLESWSSREKIHNAIQAADNAGGFFSSQIALAWGLTPAEQDFVQKFLQVRGTVSGLAQLSRGGRTTEAGIKRLQSELPDPLTVHTAKDAKMRLDRLLSEIDVAQKQGFVADTGGEEDGGDLIDQMDKLMGVPSGSKPQ
jgi:hypothetical protein